MLIPIGDINPRRRFPVFNTGLIALNVAAYFALAYRTDWRAIVDTYGLIPSSAEPLTFVTSLFLHANALHLFGNMLFLWIAGDNVEDMFGHFGYLVFYLAAGAAAGVGHVMIAQHPNMPCIGASGAVAGVLGAYLILFPGSRIQFFYFFYFFIGTFAVPSIFAIGFWFLEQLWMASYEFKGHMTNVAYAAHVAGFAAGAFTALVARLAGLVRVRRPTEYADE